MPSSAPGNCCCMLPPAAGNTAFKVFLSCDRAFSQAEPPTKALKRGHSGWVIPSGTAPRQDQGRRASGNMLATAAPCHAHSTQHTDVAHCSAVTSPSNHGALPFCHFVVQAPHSSGLHTPGRPRGLCAPPCTGNRPRQHWRRGLLVGSWHGPGLALCLLTMWCSPGGTLDLLPRVTPGTKE